MRKLKIKFILIASVSFLAVLFMVLGLVNYISLRSVRDDIYTTLKIIIDNGGLPEYSNKKYNKYDIVVTARVIFSLTSII